MSIIHSPYTLKLFRSELVERRLYQEKIYRTCLTHNTLVVLPTGLGKTVIATMVSAAMLELNPDSQVVMSAPTKPLVEQHLETFRKFLNLSSGEIVSLTGHIEPKLRSKLWRRAKVIISTPQTLQNDIIAGRCNPRRWSLLIIDEAHRALGDHPYVFIAKYVRENKFNTKILALTASPGSTKEQLLEITKNLGINAIEVRTEKDYDVRRYVQPIEIEWIFCNMTPEMNQFRKLILEMMRDWVKRVREAGYNISPPSGLTKSELLELKKLIMNLGELDTNARITISAINNLMRLLYMLELLEAQGIIALREKMEEINALASRKGSPRSLKMLVNDERWLKIFNALKEYKGEKHPKLTALKELLKKIYHEDPNARGMVFTSIRGVVKSIVEEMKNVSGVIPSIFIGQAKKGGPGMKQREQLRVLELFRKGIINLLVSTQIGEEGLDISECKFVVFYDNPPSAIRMIQRLGRTGRRLPGKAYIMITKGTRDEGYYWAGIKKKKEMLKFLKEFSKDNVKLYELLNEKAGTEKLIEKKRQPRITQERTVSSNIVIYMDNRELASNVARELILRDVDVKPLNLPVGDYVVSDEVVIERKTTEDFARSIIDRRLFEQVIRMKEAYPKPILIIEGENVYSPIINPEAVRGAIASLMIDYGIPVLHVRSPEETALMIISIAKREQEERKRIPSIKSGKRPITLKDQQEALVSSLPGIDLTLAKRLLTYFGSPRRIFNATKYELRRVEGIGEKLSNKIREVIDTKYED